MAVEILTPCRDQSHGEAECAIRCDNIGEPVWNEFFGGWFHVEELLTPQERTARAHAKLAEERIRAKTREYERRTTGGFIEFMEFTMPSPAEWVQRHYDDLAREPSDPGTTIPPELNP